MLWIRHFISKISFRNVFRNSSIQAKNIYWQVVIGGQMMKGLFIPEITAETFRTGCLESIETLMAEGEICDIEHSEWTPINVKMANKDLPEDYQRVLITVMKCTGDKVVRVAIYSIKRKIFLVAENNEWWMVGEEGLLAWKPLPKPYEEESEG